MTRIHVNLKRFDVPKDAGGICPDADPVRWMDGVMTEAAKASAGSGTTVEYVIYPPESLVPTAVAAINRVRDRGNIRIGVQGVHWEDISVGGNFGAFTTSLPAAAISPYGATAALVGHSEERLKLANLVAAYDPEVRTDTARMKNANRTVNQTIASSARLAIAAGLRVTLCVGETAEERGSEPVDFSRVVAVLRAQVEPLGSITDTDNVVIAYEPRWAIGPGKTPPGADYIGRVATELKNISQDITGRRLPVLYGGGLKAENAASIGGVADIDGGLIALTKFTDPIGFDVSEMTRIVEIFQSGTQG